MIFSDINVTTTDVVAILVVDSLFPAGIQLTHFTADAALSMDSIDVTETRMGVDGRMVAGYIPGIYPVSISLEAVSPAAKSFGHLWQCMQLNKTIYEVHLSVTLPSQSKTYIWRKGVLKSGIPFPSVKQTLDATQWVFHFEQFNFAGI